MSETKFTPGPWAKGDENNACSDLDVGGTIISLSRFDRHSDEFVISRDEMLANRDLIAAAPDMYAELETLRDLVEHCYWIFHEAGDVEMNNLCIAAEMRAAALLKKARGEV